MKKQLMVLVSLLSLLAYPAYAKNSPIVNFQDQAIARFDNQKLTKDEVGETIRRAANSLHWRVSPGDRPDQIIATLVVRGKHTAVVEITFSEEKYSIRYKSSINLDWNEAKTIISTSHGQINTDTVETIHPNYNKWVSYLNDEIANQLQAATPQSISTQIKRTENDEVTQMEKLKSMRDRGLITNEEYNRKKKEILDRM